MISKEAISYDLRESRSALKTGLKKEAEGHLEMLIANLQLLLEPRRGARCRTEDPAYPADRFGRERVRSLHVFCCEAAHALTRNDPNWADALLQRAQKMWDESDGL